MGRDALNSDGETKRRTNEQGSKRIMRTWVRKSFAWGPALRLTVSDETVAAPSVSMSLVIRASCSNCRSISSGGERKGRYMLRVLVSVASAPAVGRCGIVPCRRRTPWDVVVVSLVDVVQLHHLSDHVRSIFWWWRRRCIVL